MRLAAGGLRETREALAGRFFGAVCGFYWLGRMLPTLKHLNNM